MIKEFWEKASIVLGLILICAIQFWIGWIVGRVSVQAVPAPKGHIIAESPKPEERSGTIDHPVITLARSVADTRVVDWSKSKRPQETPTRAAEILAETKSGEQLNLKLVETMSDDKTTRITVTSDDGKILTGSDYSFPTQPLPDRKEKRWGVLAMAKSTQFSKPNFGAGIVYNRGPIIVFVGGFRNEALAGVGLRF